MAGHSKTHDQNSAARKTADNKTSGGALDIHDTNITHISSDADLKAGADTAAKPSAHAENTKRTDR
jgi:hypothetical protein